MTESPFLEGELVILRPTQIEDYTQDLMQWVADREATRYLTRGVFPHSKERLEQLYQESYLSPESVELAVVDRKSDITVGITGLHQLNWIARSAEFRILIGNSASRGRGLGTETVMIVAAYGFEILNLNKIWLGVSASNERASRSYERAGFISEGRLRQEIFKNGSYKDVLRMSMLRNEYEIVSKEWGCWPRICQQLRD